MLSKIKTKQEIEKNKTRNKLIVGFILILIMILSTIGFSFLSKEQNNSNIIINEKGVDFYKQSNIWIADINNQQYQFQYLPSQVSDIEINGTVNLNNYINQVAYIVNVNEGASEVLVNLQRYLLRYQEACKEELNCSSEDLPIKDCSENLFIFEEGKEETKVIIENKCVYIKGDQLRASDAFLYKVLNIN